MPFGTLGRKIRWTLAAGKALTFCCSNLRPTILAFAIFVIGSGTASASRIDREIASLCDRAAIMASQTSGVPLDVLKAISRTETGRPAGSGLQPWPWTVNMEGTGRWFATLDEARSYVFQHFKTGARSFDVGCFQINYKWHGAAFRSIDDMFDPVLNAQYAAQFLIELFQEFGTWPGAAGAYHSRTPEFARKYGARFERIRAGLSGEPEITLAYQAGDGRLFAAANGNQTQISGPRPLLQGGSLALGSLVPIRRLSGAGPRPFVVIN